MTTETEYPLIENLELVKRKKFETPEQRLHAIITVLDEEASSRWVERDSDEAVPVEMRRQSNYRWDVASCVFKDDDILHMMRVKELTNTVTQSHLLCVSLPEIFYDMAANLLYLSYAKDSGSQLTAEENNEIIKTIFGEQFSRLDQAFHEWLIEHVPKMLVVHPAWTNTDPVKYTASQVQHYRTTYEGSFFMPHIEEAIQNVTG
jgi:hypothetical protein